MRKILKYILMVSCFCAIVTAVSVALPPGFLLPSPGESNTGITAVVVSLKDVPVRNECIMVFDVEGERLEIVEPLSSCNRYSVGDRVAI